MVIGHTVRGLPIYNWESIERNLQSGILRLSSLHLDVLAEIYISLHRNDELARFINAMGTNLGPGYDMSDPIHRMSDAELALLEGRDTIWHFDSALVNAIRDRVENRIAALLEVEWLGGENAEAAGVERIRLLQSSTLLKEVDELTTTVWVEGNQEYRTVLFGSSTSPGISITSGNDGSKAISFVQLDKLVNITGELIATLPMPGSPGDTMHLSNFKARTLEISRAYGFTDDVNDEESAGWQINERSRSSGLQNHNFNHGVSIFNSVVSTGVGLIPIVGNVIDNLTKVTDHLIKSQDVNRVRNDINEVADATSLVRIVDDERLNAVFVSENGIYTPPQLWFSPDESITRRRETLPSGRPDY
jgi:hypothetical protein